MRERLLGAFDDIYIDNLHGDKYSDGKKFEGKPDPSVFSSPANREGIQVGTAVATLVRTGPTEGSDIINYRDIRGADKLPQLKLLAAPADSLSGIGRKEFPYLKFRPLPELGLTFLPQKMGIGYLDTPTLPELFPSSFAGIKTSRDEALIDLERSNLEVRMRAYFNPSVSNEQIKTSYPKLMQASGRFKPVETRNVLIKNGFDTGIIIPYLYRPFDLRWLYWHPQTKLLDEKRPEYMRGLMSNNIFLEARQRTATTFDRGIVSAGLADNLGNGLSNYFPLYVTQQVADAEPVLNLSKRAWEYVYGTGEAPESLFYHALAVMHSSVYRARNAGALQQDWPRVPLPPDPAILAGSAALGRQLAALLDVAKQMKGVTQGTITAELVVVAAPRHREDGQALDENEGHFDVKARWGRVGHTGQVMPGSGLLSGPRVMGEYRSSNWGIEAVNVHLNDDVYWANVPSGVWNYTLGGYQVLKKWLSYRSYDVLGRGLHLREVEEFTNIARRIAALLLLYPALNANYKSMLAPIDEDILVAV